MSQLDCPACGAKACECTVPQVKPSVYTSAGVNVGDKLPAYTSLGCYPIVYYTKSGETLCAECATSNTDESDPVILCDVYWEGPADFCVECNEELESAYGDPDAPEESSHDDSV